MQKKEKSGYYNHSKHQQPKAPQQQEQNPQHHNSVVGLYTHKQLVKALNNPVQQQEQNNLDLNAHAIRRLAHQ